MIQISELSDGKIKGTMINVKESSRKGEQLS